MWVIEEHHIEENSNKIAAKRCFEGRAVQKENAVDG